MATQAKNTQVDWKTIVGLVAIVVAVMWIWPSLQQKSIERPAGNFAFQTVLNESGQLTDFLGEPVILHFWATWCQVCAYELPQIQALEKSYPLLNIASQSGTNAEVLRHAEQNKMVIKNIVNDQNGKISQQYNVIGFPTTLLVDGQGVIRYQKIGKITAQEITDWYEKLR